MERMFVEANQLKLLNKLDDALDIYKKILESMPTNAAVHHDMARIYLELDNADEAGRFGRKACNLDPENYWYLTSLAMIYEESGEFGLAAEAYGILADRIGKESLFEKWALNLIEDNQPSEAIRVYERMELQFPDGLRYGIKRTDLLFSTGEEKTAERVLESLIRKFPDEVSPRMKLAQYYILDGNNRKAKKALEGVLEVDPSNEEAILRLRAMEEGQEGSSNHELFSFISDQRIGLDNKIKALVPLMLERGDSPTAITTSELVHLTGILAEQYSDRAEANAIYGDALFQDGQYPEAALAYRRSVDINKTVYPVWDQLMSSLLYARDLDQLEKSTEEVMDYYPNQAGPLHYMAQVLFHQGDYEESLEWLDEADLIGGRNSAYSESNVQLRALVYGEQGDPKKGIEALLIFEDRHEHIGPSTLELIGDLYFKLNDKEAAGTYWRRAMSEGGNHERIGIKLQSI